MDRDHLPCGSFLWKVPESTCIESPLSNGSTSPVTSSSSESEAGVGSFCSEVPGRLRFCTSLIEAVECRTFFGGGPAWDAGADFLVEDFAITCGHVLAPWTDATSMCIVPRMAQK